MHVRTCAHVQARRLKEFYTLCSQRQQPSTQQHIRATSKIFSGKGGEEDDGLVEVVPRLTARFLAQRSLREAETRSGWRGT
jgi:hypothetical protein